MFVGKSEIIRKWALFLEGLLVDYIGHLGDITAVVFLQNID